MTISGNDKKVLSHTEVAKIFSTFAKEDEMLSPKMTGRDIAVLAHLYVADEEHRTLDAISLEIDTDKSNVARIMKKLEGLGLIARNKPYSDGRIMLLSLTEAGQEYVREKFIFPLEDAIDFTLDGK